MNKNVKKSGFAGVILYALAALFAISLMLVLFDFGGVNAANGTLLYKFGKLFTGVYGICSALIPVFLLTAAFQCFTRTWHIRSGVLLAGSVIPFFTLDALEHVIRMLLANNTGDALIMKMTAAVLTGLIIVAVEYVVLSMLGDAVENAGQDASDKENDYCSPEVETEESAEDEKDEQQEELARAVAKDAGRIISVKNNLKALREKIAERRRALEESRLLEEEKARQSQAGAKNIEEAVPAEAESEKAFETVEGAETEAEDNSEVQEDSGLQKEADVPEETEENPFEHVFDEQEEDESPEAAIDESAEENFEETVIDFPEESEPDEMSADESAEDGAEESFEDGTEENSDNSPFDDFDYPAEPEPLSADVYDDAESSGEFQADLTEEGAVENSSDDEFDDDGFGDDGFGDETLDSETDGDAGDLSAFVEQRNSNFQSIFAQMDSDAASNPVESRTQSFDEDFDNLFDESEIEKGVPQELEQDLSVKDPMEDFEFDPSADPVVDSNGLPYGPAVPFDIEDNSFEEVTKAKKNSKPLSFAERAVFLQDSGESSENSALNGGHSPDFAEEAPKKEKAKPKLKLSNYKIPVEGILQEYDNGEYWVIDDATKKKAEDLKQTLAEFNIEVEVTGIRKGPVVTMFEVLPAPGVNVNKIRSLQDNIALRLAATSVRIVSPIPGKSAVGIEIPNQSRAVVSFREIMEKKNPAFDKMAIPVILGKDISGEPQIIDLAKTPHLLIAGSTGAGKSVCVNSLILSILYKRAPNLVKLILIDPKVVELKLYNDIPHLLTPVITEPNKALQSLQYCLCEMERRYAMLDNMGVRDITSYNRRIDERGLMQEKLPYIVVIIDEFADLMATSGKELENIVARLTAMSRAVGIHLVLATQRPSVNVITGLIKANIPTRIAFMVASRTDSNIIIDTVGAEKLLGRGDMLYASAVDPAPTRIQGTFISDQEVEDVVNAVKEYGEPDYIDDEIFVDDEEDEARDLFGEPMDDDDPLYDQALEIVVQSGKASASYIQRRLKIGYNRAARLVEEMEERGIVGPQNGSKPREIIHIPS
jgi:S-DNA-T family DNA segregation ATPase FtsK/SpoIIIE